MTLSARIGLEIHLQANVLRKLFSPAPAPSLNSTPNVCTSVFDAALPGTLPTLSYDAVVAAVRMSSALSCKINERCEFDRKHYFYFDQPAGFQITQQRRPLAVDGSLKFYVHDKLVTPYSRTVGIQRLQVEQDTGKSIHDATSDTTVVDLNRAGLTLMEIVTEPTMKSGLEAACFVHELLCIARSVRASLARADHAEYRVDANVSIDDDSTGERYPRVEVKNLSGLKFVRKAVEFEIARQMESIREGRPVMRETRHFNPSGGGKTFPLRTKENTYDYRYMPEPNLPPLRISRKATSQPTHEIVIDDVIVEPKAPFGLAAEWIERGANANHAVVIAQSSTWCSYAQEMVSADPDCIAHALTTLWLQYRPWFNQGDKVGLSLKFQLFAYHASGPDPQSVIPDNFWRIKDPVIIEEECAKALKLQRIVDELHKVHPTKSNRKAKAYAKLIEFELIPLQKNIDPADWDRSLRKLFYKM